jgi:hypothetical protein
LGEDSVEIVLDSLVFVVIVWRNDNTEGKLLLIEVEIILLI